MEKIKLTTDSAGDLPKELIERLNVAVLPLYVILDDKEYLDGEISPEVFYETVARTKQLPKTAARTPEDFTEFFGQYTKQGYKVLHIGLSTGISLNTTSAMRAAEQMEGVYVIDTRALSTAVSLLLFYADDLIKQGLDAKTIYEKCSARVQSIYCSFVVNSLEYLRKGGRCSALQYLGANLLRIKPTIVMTDGKMKMGKKYRGNLASVAQSYINDVFDEYTTPDLSRIFVTHTELEPEVLEALLSTVKSRHEFKEVLETTAGLTITSHCGKGTFGILFMNDGDKL